MSAPRHRARRRETTGDRPLPAWLTKAVTAVIGWGAGRRRARLFHPRGMVFDAVFSVTGTRDWGVPLLDRPGEYRALARWSKAVPTPRGLPDVLGLAIRVDDAGGAGSPLDLALATTGSRPVLRHLLVPRRDFAVTYTSLLPYRVGTRHRLLAAVPADPARRVPADLTDAADVAVPVAFRIAVAAPTGPWRQVATLTLVAPRPDAARLAFDVTGHALDGFRPCGRLNRLRGPAYRASRRARGAADDG
ncbi:hypothetical protein [Saccharothrix australiensis]|uniref:Phosphodiesterase n=1 Tax=Saccharothrix australiensis TaxID=2072 RepID=A0A495W3B0_9PSEU|nr:hypothetical protein [Saccharothrix australiensis]RKT56152.1 hypothetical protein C8E97_4841 [Saccharothrix australiensis]